MIIGSWYKWLLHVVLVTADGFKMLNLLVAEERIRRNHPFLKIEV